MTGVIDTRDTGYAWVILAAACANLFIVAIATIGSVGAMFVEVLAYFPNASKTDVSWLGSIQILTLGVGGKQISIVRPYLITLHKSNVVVESWLIC